MSSDKAIEAMRNYSKGNSKALQQRVREVVAGMVAEGLAVNVSAVARTAQVSREFIHSHPDLLELIRSSPSVSQRPASKSSGEVPAHLTAGLRADRATLLAKIEKQKVKISQQAERIAGLERQRKLWLGAQLGESLIDPDDHRELRMTNDRLVSENTALTAKVAELRSLVATLEEDLAASRQAHIEDLAALSGDARVKPLRRPPASS